MNTKNLEYLKEGLKFLGFGDKLNPELENKVNQQTPEFQLQFTTEYKKGESTEKMEYKLDFRKSDQSDMYFFNRYQATLKNENPELEKSQTFYITRNSGITAKEAYNLLDGRAVNKDLTNKEGQPFNAWLQLEFSEKDKNNNFKVKQFHAGYGYDLDVVLKKYPIKELASQDEKDKLIKSLEKGNTQKVTFVREGKEAGMFVEANPQYKSLKVYDSRMQKVFQGNERKETNGAEQSKERKETVKQEGEDETEAKKSKKRGVRV